VRKVAFSSSLRKSRCWTEPSFSTMDCQSQSLNLFLPADIDKWDLHMLHWTAWKRGIKSLYYCRSKSISRAAFAGKLEAKAEEGEKPVFDNQAPTDYEECLACQ
jgi:ribonucleoside-diphosphate reductase alpha chain